MTPDPINWLRNGVLAPGSLDFVSQTTGVPAGGTVQLGSTSASDITLVFDVSLVDDGTPSEGFIGILSTGSISGVGTIASADRDLAMALGDQGCGYCPPGVNVAIGDAVTITGDLLQTEPYDDFFVSFSSLSVGDTLTVLGCVVDEDIPGTACVDPSLFSFGTGTVVVPEPTTTLLLGLGITGLVLRRRLPT